MSELSIAVKVKCDQCNGEGMDHAIGLAWVCHKCQGTKLMDHNISLDEFANIIADKIMNYPIPPVSTGFPIKGG